MIYIYVYIHPSFLHYTIDGEFRMDLTIQSAVLDEKLLQEPLDQLRIIAAIGPSLDYSHIANVLPALREDELLAATTTTTNTTTTTTTTRANMGIMMNNKADHSVSNHQHHQSGKNRRTIAAFKCYLDPPPSHHHHLNSNTSTNLEGNGWEDTLRDDDNDGEDDSDMYAKEAYKQIAPETQVDGTIVDEAMKEDRSQLMTDCDFPPSPSDDTPSNYFSQFDMIDTQFSIVEDKKMNVEREDDEEDDDEVVLCPINNQMLSQVGTEVELTQVGTEVEMTQVGTEVESTQVGTEVDHTIHFGGSADNHNDQDIRSLTRLKQLDLKLQQAYHEASTLVSSSAMKQAYNYLKLPDSLEKHNTVADVPHTAVDNTTIPTEVAAIHHDEEEMNNDNNYVNTNESLLSINLRVHNDPTELYRSVDIMTIDDRFDLQEWYANSQPINNNIVGQESNMLVYNNESLDMRNGLTSSIPQQLSRQQQQQEQQQQQQQQQLSGQQQQEQLQQQQQQQLQQSSCKGSSSSVIYTQSPHNNHNLSQLPSSSKTSRFLSSPIRSSNNNSNNSICRSRKSNVNKFENSSRSKIGKDSTNTQNFFPNKIKIEPSSSSSTNNVSIKVEQSLSDHPLSGQQQQQQQQPSQPSSLTVAKVTAVTTELSSFNHNNIIINNNIINNNNSQLSEATINTQSSSLSSLNNINSHHAKLRFRRSITTIGSIHSKYKSKKNTFLHRRVRKKFISGYYEGTVVCRRG